MRPIFASILMACATALSGPCSAREETLRIIEFLDMAGTAKNALSEPLRKKAVTEMTPIDRAISDGIGQFDDKELNHRLEPVFDRYLTESDLKVFMDFINSPSGPSLARILKEQKTPEGIRTAVGALPPDARWASNNFLNSRGSAGVMSVWNSDETRAVLDGYFEELVCAQAARDPPLIERLRSNGKCGGVSPRR